MKRFLPNSAILAISSLPIIAPASRIVQTPILGNYPNTSVPLSTEITVTPDIAPTNTARINVSTSTSFNGALAADPATGMVRVTNAQPAGAYTITVRAFDNGGASATKTFTLTVTTPEMCVPVSFAPAGNFNAGFNPDSVVTADFNGDGKQDLAAACGDSLSILLSNGDGTFQTAMNYSVHGLEVAVGDVNGDGRQDLAVANADGNAVSILLGDGAGHFGAATNFAAGTYPQAVAIGDFNGDGRQDLAVGNFLSNNISILLGDGAGNFSTATNFAPGSDPASVVVGDFNGDGKQDLAVANYTSNNVLILLGDGAGNFSTATSFAAGSAPESVVVGDFNGDGKQDLAVANFHSNNVSILLGNGAGTFGPATNFGAGSGPRSVAVGDFNGDNKQDLVVANQGGEVSILLGDGAGNFGAVTYFAAGGSPQSVSVGDFTADGKQDLVVSNAADFIVGTPGNLSFLLRNCALTPTSVVSRKTHAGAGSFDIPLPLTGTPAIECRSGGATNDYTIALTFPGNVNVDGNPQAQVTSGMGMVGSNGMSNGGTVSITGNIVTIPLTNVANAQTINVMLNGVNGSGNVIIPIKVLVGDVNGNSAVNASDVALAKGRVGQSVDATNFRTDINANGAINATDVSLVRSYVGTGLP